MVFVFNFLYGSPISIYKSDSVLSKFLNLTSCDPSKGVREATRREDVSETRTIYESP